MPEEPKMLPTRKGLFFEEFEPGQVVTTMGRTITESDLVTFASFSGDWNSIHSDAVYAAQTPFGQRIVHGLAGLSIANALAVRTGFMEDTVIAFRELRDWKFSRPIFIGDTIHAHITVTEVKAVRRLGGGLVTFTVEVLNQDNVVVQHGTWTVLVKSNRV